MCLVLSRSAKVLNSKVSLTPNLTVWLILNKSQQMDRNVVGLRFISQTNAPLGFTALTCKFSCIVDGTKVLRL